MKILDIGSGPNSVAKVVFPDAEVIRLDGDKGVNPDVVHNIENPFPKRLHGEFDLVYCSHVLEHISRLKVIEVLKNMRAALREGGELWVIVPSLEWAAREILSDTPSPVLIPFIYGGQDNEYQFHKCGFTLNLLRQLFVMVGFIPRQVYQAPFSIQSSGKNFPAIQNIVIGMKVSEPPAQEVKDDDLHTTNS